MGQLAIPLMAAGAFVGAAGKMQAGNAQAANYQYQSMVAQNNYQISQQNADSALFAGQGQESAEKAKISNIIGEEKAGQAANGVDVNVGSAARVREQTQSVGDIDAAMIRYNAAREAYGYRNQAQQYAAQAQMDQMGAKQSRIGSLFGAASTLIGGASSISGSLGKLKLAGAGAFG